MNKKLFYSNIQHLTSQLKFDKRKFLSEYPSNHKRFEEILDQKLVPDLNDLIYIAQFFKLSIDQLLTLDLKQRHKINPKSVKMLVLDVDGTLTDGKIVYTENGDELKFFNAKDGLAMRKVAKSGVITALLSHGITENVIKKRAEVLGCKYYYCGTESKMDVLNIWLKKEKLKPADVCFVGDDLNDEEILSNVGLSACPGNAVEIIKNKAHVVLNKNGGEGCIRELIDNYLQIQQ